MASRHSALEPAATVLRWVRAPQQARTRAGLARLLEAAEALIAEKSYEEASIVDIAQRAGSSVGGFYRRFRDKDGIIQALHEQFCDEARATADEALAPARWQGAPLADVLAEFTAFLVQIFREREGLLRAFLKHAAGDAAMRERSRGLFQHLWERLSELLRSRRHEVRHPDPELGAAFGLEMVLGTLDHVVQLPEQAVPLRDARLIAELSRALTHYLGVETGTPHLRLTKRRSPA
jgi:AcrR family transcriptional regulator